MYFGADGVHEDNIEIHNNDCIMLQSHIAGDWNDNVWNELNYQKTKHHLEFLTQNHNITFKTINEL